MSLLILAALIAASVSAVVSVLSLYESRLRLTVPESNEAAPLVPSPDPPVSDGLCIVSCRARCACGHALEEHDRYAGDPCGCRQFEYAGGLVSPAKAAA